jgi:hypothetical protein
MEQAGNRPVARRFVAAVRSKPGGSIVTGVSFDRLFAPRPEPLVTFRQPALIEAIARESSTRAIRF